MLKSWLLVLGTILLLSWLLTRPLRNSTLPGLLTRGTGQILVQWRDALNAYKADEGKFPPLDTKDSAEDSRLSALTGDNSAQKEYLNRDTIALNNVMPIDAWGHRLIFDPEHTGDQSHVLSTGPDDFPGTEDDIDSQSLTNLHLPTPTDSAK